MDFPQFPQFPKFGKAAPRLSTSAIPELIKPDKVFEPGEIPHGGGGIPHVPSANMAEAGGEGSNIGRMVGIGLVTLAAAGALLHHRHQKNKKEANFTQQPPTLAAQSFQQTEAQQQPNMDQPSLRPPSGPIQGTINTEPPGNMAGYNNAPTTMLQQSSTGYDSASPRRSMRSMFPSFTNPRSRFPSFDERFNLNRYVQPQNTILANRDLESYI